MNCMKRCAWRLFGKTLTVAALGLGTTESALINVTTNDNYTKIEGATAGDEVAIAAGTYAFRVYLTKTGHTNQPNPDPGVGSVQASGV